MYLHFETMSFTLFMSAVLSFSVTLASGSLLYYTRRYWVLRDREDGRPIGGPAVLLGILAGGIFISPGLNYLFLVGAGVVFFVGLVDDLIDLSPWQKLLGQGVAATLAAVSLPVAGLSLFGFSINLQMAWYIIPFFYVVGLTNAVNLVDGLDGLVTSILLPPFVVMFLLSWQMTNHLGMGLSLTVLCSLIGFYPLNRYPTRLLLGDTGAELLGYLLAVASLLVLQKSTQAIGWAIIPALLLACVPISDILFAIARRLSCGRSIFAGDRQHIHHRLAARLGTRKTVCALTVVSLLSSLAGFLLWHIKY